MSKLSRLLVSDDCGGLMKIKASKAVNLVEQGGKRGGQVEGACYCHHVMAL